MPCKDSEDSGRVLIGQTGGQDGWQEWGLSAGEPGTWSLPRVLEGHWGQGQRPCHSSQWDGRAPAVAQGQGGALGFGPGGHSGQGGVRCGLGELLGWRPAGQRPGSAPSPTSSEPVWARAFGKRLWGRGSAQREVSVVAEPGFSHSTRSSLRASSLSLESLPSVQAPASTRQREACGQGGPPPGLGSEPLCLNCFGEGGRALSEPPPRCLQAWALWLLGPLPLPNQHLTLLLLVTSVPNNRVVGFWSHSSGT